MKLLAEPQQIGFQIRSKSFVVVKWEVVFPPVDSIRELRADDVAAFFSDCWIARFKEYDASYLLPSGAIESEVRRAIQQVLSTASVEAT